MKYCYKCGSQIQSEDMFCTNCGARQSENLKEEYKKVSGIDKSVFYETGDILLKMLIRPVSGAKYFIEKGKKNTIIMLTILFSIVQGLLGMWKVQYIVSNLEKIIVESMKSILHFLNLVDTGVNFYRSFSISEMIELSKKINSFKAFLHVPYNKIFLSSVIRFIMIILILFIVTSLFINIVSKNKVSIIKVYKAVLIVMAPMLYFQTCSIIISYLSFYIGIIMTLIGIMVSLGCLTIVVKEMLIVEENQAVIVTSISYALAIICVLMYLGNCLVNNINCINEYFTQFMSIYK